MESEGIIKLVDEERGVVILQEADGSEEEFEIVTGLDIEDDSYLILLSNEDQSTGEGYALKLTKDEEENKVYQPVIDEDELVQIQKELAKSYQ